MTDELVKVRTARLLIVAIFAAMLLGIPLIGVSSAGSTDQPTTTGTPASDHDQSLLQIFALVCPPGYDGIDFAADCGLTQTGMAATGVLFEVAGVVQHVHPIHEDAIWDVSGFGLSELTVSITSPDRRPLPVLVATCRGDQGEAIETRVIAGSSPGEVSATFFLPLNEGAVCIVSFTPLDTADLNREPLTVFAIVCDADPGLVSDPHDVAFPPEGCDPASGVTISATTGDDQPLGACSTDGKGLCELLVPKGQVIVREVIQTVPPGYTPIANPVLLRGTVAPPGIVNVREGVVLAPSGDATLTLHSRVCPAGYDGADYFTDCHGNAPSYDQTVFLIGEHGGVDAQSSEIDAAGDVTFTDLAIERYTVVPALPAESAVASVFCSLIESPGVEYPSVTVRTADSSQTSLYLGQGDAVLCDLYVTPR